MNCIQDYYASIRGLLTQLELYQPYMTDLITQHHYGEELIVDISLSSLDTSISSQIQGSILSKAHLSTLAMTFSSTLRASTKTPLVPPLLYHLTLQHYYLPIPRERGTRKMVVESALKGMMANHSLHVSIVDGLIIVLIVVGRSLANQTRLPIPPLLMILSLYP